MRSKAPKKTEQHIVAVKSPRLQLLRELVRTECEATGTKNEDVSTQLVFQAARAQVPKLKDDTERLICAISTMAEIAPQNATEAMLAVQMIAAHHAALLFLQYATSPNQNAEIVETTVLCATRLMRVFNEQVDAMQRLKGKTGQQKVTVEHVHVNEGGQAIVGAVTAHRAGRGVGDVTEKRGNTP